MIITNCGITKYNAEVVRQCVMDDSNPLYKEYGGYNPGINLSAEKIYNLFDGTIVRINNVAKGKIIIVNTSDKFCISYMYLSDVPNTLSEGDTIVNGTYLGDVYKYVHVEYLTNTQSKWPVRIGSRTFYKTDPTPMLQGGYTQIYDQISFSDLNVGVVSNYPGGDYASIDSPSVMEEFTDSR